MLLQRSRRSKNASTAAVKNSRELQDSEGDLAQHRRRAAAIEDQPLRSWSTWMAQHRTGAETSRDEQVAAEWAPSRLHCGPSRPPSRSAARLAPQPRVITWPRMCCAPTTPGRRQGGRAGGTGRRRMQRLPGGCAAEQAGCGALRGRAAYCGNCGRLLWGRGSPGGHGFLTVGASLGVGIADDIRQWSTAIRP